MARYSLKKGKKAQTPPQGGWIGCVLVILLIMAFIGWTFYLALRPE